jgi:hypothetical protein
MRRFRVPGFELRVPGCPGSNLKATVDRMATPRLVACMRPTGPSRNPELETRNPERP